MADPLGRLRTALADRYTIERELGAGGMATVYLAEDLKHHRPVAVKVLKPELSAVLGPERFLREIELSARLTHPHILPLHDSGTADGLLYYVMPYVEGESLRDRLTREKQLPLDDALQIAREVADALSYAHSHGIIHRDIKPENILLQSGHAVVADFGIARAIATAGSERLTETGLAIGTPAYMSPEQAAGRHDVDGRSDLYSLGCVLYEMLGGDPPFYASTPQAVLAKKLSEPLPRISVVREAVPAGIEAALNKALARTPADRFATAAQLGAALGGAASPTAMPAAPAWLRRQWTRAALLGVVGVALLLGAVVLRHRLLPSTTIAVLPFTSQSPDTSDAYLAEGVTEELGDQLTQLSHLQVKARGVVEAEWRRNGDPLGAARALGVAWYLHGAVRHVARELLVNVELVRPASGEQVWAKRFTRGDADVFAVQAEVAESVALVVGGRLSPGEREAMSRRPTGNNEAYRLYLYGNSLMARRTGVDVGRSVEAYEQAIRLDVRFAAAWARLGYARGLQYAWGWPERLPHDSLLALAGAAALRSLELDSMNADAWLADGYALYLRGDLWMAQSSYARALSLDSTNAELSYVVGAVYACDPRGLGLPAVAAPWFRRTLALDPGQRNAWRQLALVARAEGRLADEEALWDSAASLGPWVPALSQRADTRFRRGNSTGALADLAAAEALDSLEHESVLYHSIGMRDNRALYLIGTGDTGPARAALVRLRAARDSALLDGYYAPVALFSMALGQREQALAALQRLRSVPAARELRCAPGTPCSTSIVTWRALKDPLFAPLRADPRFKRMWEEARPRVPWLVGYH
ncbi:MAG: serine/threonine-protein kinase [Gemmatimonadales bacterium]